jgi:hypothetical protein
MSTAAPTNAEVNLQAGLDPLVFKQLQAYCTKHGLSLQDVANTILMNFLEESASSNDSEPGREIVVDDDTYDFIESKIEEGLSSVKTDDDWVSDEEMSEFIKTLKSS